MNEVVSNDRLKAAVALDEAEAEFRDENPLELRLFQYMNSLVGTGLGFKLEAQSNVSSLYLKQEGEDKLICILYEEQRSAYFFSEIGNMLNKTLPDEKIRDQLLAYRRDLRKENYNIYAL